MGRGAFLKTSFNAGELSPLLDGRSDLEKYPQGCSLLENFIPTVQGPIYHRPGTQFVDAPIHPVNTDHEVIQWIPFVFNRTQSYALLAIRTAFRLGSQEWHGLNLHVYYGGGPVMVPGPLPGDDPVPLVIAAPETWLEERRFQNGTTVIRFAQSGDVIYLASDNTRLHKVKRLSATSWEMTAVEFDVSPQLDFIDTARYRLARDAAQDHIVNGVDAFGRDYYWGVNGGFKIQASTRELYGYLPSQYRGKMFVKWAAEDLLLTRSSDGVKYFQDKLVMPLANGEYLYYGRFYSHAGRIYRATGDVLVTTAGDPAAGYITRCGTSLPTHTKGSQTYYTDYAGMSNKYFTLEYISMGVYEFSVNSFVPTFVDGGDGRGLLECETDSWIPFTYVSSIAYGATVECGLSNPDVVQDFDNNPLPRFNETQNTIINQALSLGAKWVTDVKFFRNRLILLAGDMVIGSVAGDYENFSRYSDNGDVTADMGFLVRVATGDISEPLWMESGRDLILASSWGEMVITEADPARPLGPTNIKITTESTYGAFDRPPVQLDSDVVYIQRSGFRLRRMTWSQDRGGMESVDMCALAEHLGKGGFRSMAWQREPSSLLWCVMADGSLLSATYSREQVVAAWARHSLGGEVIAVCAIPSSDGIRDVLWLAVRRIMGEIQRICVETITDYAGEPLDVSDARYLDSALSYTGAPANTFSGLGHLEGESVLAVGDGIVYTGLTVSLGEVTIPGDPVSKVSIGKYQPARVRTMRLHLGADDGVNMGKTARLTRASARLVDTVNIRAGGDFTNMNRLDFRDGGQAMDVAVPSQSEERTWSPRGGYSSEAYLCLEQDQPLPATIVSLGLEFEVN